MRMAGGVRLLSLVAGCVRMHVGCWVLQPPCAGARSSRAVAPAVSPCHCASSVSSFFPFELWSGCPSFFLPDLSFGGWPALTVVFVVLLRPRPTVAGGVRVRRGCVSGAEPTSVRGSVYWGPFGTRLRLRCTWLSGPARRVPGGEHRCSGGEVGKSQSCWGVVSGQFWAGFGSVRWIASW